MLQRMLTAVLLAGCLVGNAGAESQQRYNQIHFQVGASEDVANDRMQAVLAVTDEDRDAAKLANRVNEAMAWALDQGRAAKGVDLRSGSYSTHPVYDEKRIVNWRASQELILDGADFAQIGALIGSLQSRLQLRGVSFSVARQTRDAAEARLIDRALDDFRHRADQIRTRLGAAGYRIVDAQIMTDGGPIEPVPMMRAKAMSMAEVAPPALEGGESELRVTVSGTIELSVQ